MLNRDNVFSYELKSSGFRLRQIAKDTNKCPPFNAQRQCCYNNYSKKTHKKLGFIIPKSYSVTQYACTWISFKSDYAAIPNENQEVYNIQQSTCSTRYSLVGDTGYWDKLFYIQKAKDTLKISEVARYLTTIVKEMALFWL